LAGYRDTRRRSVSFALVSPSRRAFRASDVYAAFIDEGDTMSKQLQPSLAAMETIREQHQHLGAILDGMLQFVELVRMGGEAPELKMFRAMLFYIGEYPERLYYPNEDRYLFAKLRKRTRELDVPLAELEFLRCRSAGLLRNLEHALNRYEFAGQPAFTGFASLVADYVAFFRAQMQLEEEVILSGAARILTQEDWEEFDLMSAETAPLGALGMGRSLQRDFENMAALAGKTVLPPMARPGTA
jgi:hemerythrin-like domain-containing protein